MTNSINNDIPFVPENTIDPAAGLNIAINVIDALLQCSVISIGDNDPPSEGVEGNRYIVGDTPTGVWDESAGKLARFLDGAWDFYEAKYVLNQADNRLYTNNSGTWTPVEPLVLMRGGIPLIKIPTFTGGASGAITLGSAIDFPYPECYGYFGADVLAVGNLAGFYPCVMTTTTDGTVYNNRYVPVTGEPAVFPTTLTPFASPIVGGDGVVGTYDAVKVMVPAGFDNGSIINFTGLLQSTIDSEFDLTLGGVSWFGSTPVAQYATFQTISLAAISSQIQQPTFCIIPIWVFIEVDMTTEQELVLKFTSTDPTSYITLTGFGVELDDRR